MKLGNLIEKLSALVEADPYRKDMDVVFGKDCNIGCGPHGAIIGKRDGLAVLVLAPISLAGVAHTRGGGF